MCVFRHRQQSENKCNMYWPYFQLYMIKSVPARTLVCGANSRAAFFSREKIGYEFSEHTKEKFPFLKFVVMRVKSRSAYLYKARKHDAVRFKKKLRVQLIGKCTRESMVLEFIAKCSMCIGKKNSYKKLLKKAV